MFEPVVDRLHRYALRGLTVSELFTRYRSSNDEQAFAELIDRTGPPLRAGCTPYLQDLHEIDEVVQEVFRLLTERQETIREADSVEAWLQQAAINVARNFSRRRARQGSQRSDSLDVLDPSPGPDVLVELREKHAYVLAEIERLSGDWKKAFTLKLLEDRSYAEVAEILGASLDKVKQDVCRARKELRSRLLRRGIVLPAAIATMLFGGKTWSANVNRWWAAGAIALAGLGGIAVLIACLEPRSDPARPSPPVYAEPGVAIRRPPDPEQQTLDRVLPLLDKIAGARSKRTAVVHSNEHTVQWRFGWQADPARGPAAKFHYHPWLSERSFVDLHYDRWSGELTILLAPDGVTFEKLDPSRPIRLRLFGAEVRVEVPEVEQLIEAFDPLHMNEPPPDDGPADRREVLTYPFNSGRDVVHRPPPRYGLVVSLLPGESVMVACKDGIGVGSAQLLVWRCDRAIGIQSLHPRNGPWQYRNDSDQPLRLFLAAINPVGSHSWTCQTKVTREAKNAWRLDFDRDYRDRLEDFSASVRVLPTTEDK